MVWGKKMSGYWSLSTMVKRKVLPGLRSQHLDFGCGVGGWPHFLGRVNRQLKIVGYDPSVQKIQHARKFNRRQNVQFVYSPEIIRSCRDHFSSSTVFFVLHEAGDAALEEVRHTLSPGGLVYVMDYDIKGMGKAEFIDFFDSEYEIEEMRQLGIDKAHRLHTSRGLEECLATAERIGFKTLDTEVFEEGYFIWAGQKIGRC